MADDIENETREHKNVLCVRKLPKNVIAKQITELFEPYGMIVNLYLKRRVSKHSPVLLENPFVIIVFENEHVVNEIMASRPFYLDGNQLLLRRFLPKPLRSADEPNYVSKKALVRVDDRHPNDILPDDDSIINYLKNFGDRIEYSARLDDQTFLVQFDDYDPVDLTYLYQPHYIGEQLVIIEKCLDEQRVREQVAARQKDWLRNTTDNQVFHSFSPVPILSYDEQKQDLMTEHEQKIIELEQRQEQLVRQLKDQHRSIVEERIRFQRLTLDMEQNRDEILIENRNWQRLYSESIQEKAKVQQDGEQKLKEIDEKISTITTKRSSSSS